MTVMGMHNKEGGFFLVMDFVSFSLADSLAPYSTLSAHQKPNTQTDVRFNFLKYTSRKLAGQLVEN